MIVSALEFKSYALQQKFRALVDYLESHLVFVREFLGTFLQTKQIIGVQITFVVRGALAGKNRFFQIIHAGLLSAAR